MPLNEMPLSTHIALYNDYAIDVPHEILSTWVGEAARMEARIAELEEQIDTQQGLRGLLERVAKAERDAAKYFQWHEDQLAATKKAERERDEAMQNDRRLRRMLDADTLYKRVRVAEDEAQEARRERDEALERGACDGG
jgi:hypothetical protein